MTIKSVIKKPKKVLTKTYAYEIYEKKDGGEGIRAVGAKKFAAGNYEELLYSKTKPSHRKEMEAAWEYGGVGLSEKTGGDYIDAVKWGMEGGRPRKWKDEAEKQKAKRARKKLQLEGWEALNEEEKELIERGRDRKAEKRQESKEALEQYLANKPVRPGALKYHNDRAATAKERKEKWKKRQQLAKSKTGGDGL